MVNATFSGPVLALRHILGVVCLQEDLDQGMAAIGEQSRIVIIPCTPTTSSAFRRPPNPRQPDPFIFALDEPHDFLRRTLAKVIFSILLFLFNLLTL